MLSCYVSRGLGSLGCGILQALWYPNFQQPELTMCPALGSTSGIQHLITSVRWPCEVTALFSPIAQARKLSLRELVICAKPLWQNVATPYLSTYVF